MHSKDIVHGFLTTENIGLSSWNWVVVTDISCYKARTALPDDDPSEYLFYYQELFNQQGSDSTPREKRCYLAPERFYTPGQAESEPLTSLTPAMDIFSAGCVIMETFLNGERALDLGDLMEYRKQQSSPTLQQKLNKIEFSALRAACRHMLSLDPTQRLSANAYLERLEASDLIPSSFAVLSTLLNDVTASSSSEGFVATPDARLAKAAAFYTVIIYETMGIYDEGGKSYFDKALGTTSSNSVEKAFSDKDAGSTELQATEIVTRNVEKKEQDTESLLAETEALLKQLEALNFDDEAVHSMAATDATTTTRNETLKAKPKVRRSQMSQNSLLVYLQLILSTVRHVHRPASKLVALQLMERIGNYSSDEARLQRIVPVTVSLLHDQDPLVRAAAVQALTSTVSTVDSFPPSDSKVFPQYIFKRVAHLVTDPSLVVRLSFAKCVAVLAETSHRFLDISHAVRLYEAVGGSAGGNASSSDQKKTNGGDVFGDDVANLLNASGDPSTKLKRQSTMDSAVSDIGEAGKTLISSSYSSDLSALHETVSRWVVHITTDLSEHSSPVKRALLADMARLCNFFGLDGVMAFILPQVLSFLNDRKDWQLRATLFEHLQDICQFIGRAATEHFVLPILETALADFHEVVISRALLCLSELLRMGLLSRGALLGRLGTGTTDESTGQV
jgi:phosphoinositide-3-kinase regulatory subunit 4